MTVVPPVDDPEKREAIEDVIERCEEQGTPGTTAIEVLGHRPEIARTFVENWNASFYQGTVDHTLKELVRLLLAGLHDCEYCTSVGSTVAKEAGLTDEKVRELPDYESSSLFTERERIALRFAEDFFHDEHDYTELKSEFTDGEVIELVWFIGLQDAGEKVVSSLGLKPDSCEMPEDELTAASE